MKGDPPAGSHKGKICETKWCPNPKALQSGGYLLSHCWKCRSRMLKERRPATYVLNAMRASARKRNLPFTITHEQFAAFCRETNYLELRGTKQNDLTINRKDHSKGYTIDNIEAIPHYLNSRMGFCVPGWEQLKQNMTRAEFEELKAAAEPDPY